MVIFHSYVNVYQRVNSDGSTSSATVSDVHHLSTVSIPCRASGARGAGRVMAKPPCQGNRPWDRPQGISAGYPAKIGKKLRKMPGFLTNDDGRIRILDSSLENSRNPARWLKNIEENAIVPWSDKTQQMLWPHCQRQWVNTPEESWVNHPQSKKSQAASNGHDQNGLSPISLWRFCVLNYMFYNIPLLNYPLSFQICRMREVWNHLPHPDCFGNIKLLPCDIKWWVGCLKTEKTLFAAQSSASAPGNRRWHHGGGCRVRQWLLDPCQLQLAMKSCKHLPWRHLNGLYMVILYSFTKGYTAPPGISKIHPTIGDQLPHGLLHDVFLYVSTAGILPKTWVKLQEFRTRFARLKSIIFQ